MKYIVKDNATATEKNPSFPAGEQHVHYIGKGECFTTKVEDFTEYGFCEGWSKEHFAKKYIEKDREWHKEHGNGMWDYDWEIIAY